MDAKRIEEEKKKQARLDAERQKALMQKALAKRSKFQESLYSLYEGFYLFSEEYGELASDTAEKSKMIRQRLDRILDEHKAVINHEHKICTTNDGKHYGDTCTIYFSPKASCYHLSTCPYCGNTYTHILTPPNNKRPCSYCKPDIIDTDWMKEAVMLYDELQRFQQFTNTTHSLPHQLSRYIDIVIHLYCRVGKLYAPPDSSQESFLMTAANGMQVRVPADKLEAWEAAQADQSEEAKKRRELMTSKVLERMEQLKQEQLEAGHSFPARIASQKQNNK